LQSEKASIIKLSLRAFAAIYIFISSAQFTDQIFQMQIELLWFGAAFSLVKLQIEMQIQLRDIFCHRV